MSREIRVDRDEELNLFYRMVIRESDERILLIHAASGLGKTVLLSEFEKRCPKGISYIPIDFKGGGTSVAGVFSLACDTLGRDRFPLLSAKLLQFVNPASVNVVDNTLFGRNLIDVALSAPDEDTRALRREALTDVFFDDLRALNRIVFAFDTFNDCRDAVVQTWLSSSFLPRVRNTPELIVVLAGQCVPEPALGWRNLCYVLELKPMIETGPWEQFADEIGAEVHPEFIHGCCFTCKGHPLTIAQAITAYAARTGE